MLNHENGMWFFKEVFFYGLSAWLITVLFLSGWLMIPRVWLISLIFYTMYRLDVYAWEVLENGYNSKRNS